MCSKRSPGGNFGKGLRKASTPVDRADRGNQPISRRVDTISKQYQQDQDDCGRPYDTAGRTQHDMDSRQNQDGYEGGGAPWES